MEIFGSMVERVRNVQKLRQLQKLNHVNEQNGPASDAYANHSRITQNKIYNAAILEAASTRKNSASFGLGRLRYHRSSLNQIKI